MDRETMWKGTKWTKFIISTTGCSWIWCNFCYTFWYTFGWITWMKTDKEWTTISISYSADTYSNTLMNYLIWWKSPCMTRIIYCSNICQIHFHFHCHFHFYSNCHFHFFWLTMSNNHPVNEKIFNFHSVFIQFSFDESITITAIIAIAISISIPATATVQFNSIQKNSRFERSWSMLSIIEFSSRWQNTCDATLDLVAFDVLKHDNSEIRVEFCE
jgi:hypothetical protein